MRRIPESIALIAIGSANDIPAERLRQVVSGDVDEALKNAAGWVKDEASEVLKMFDAE